MDRGGYVEALLGSDPDLDRVRRRMAEEGLPEIAIAPVYGRLLTLLVLARGAREVLEIGALGGYSGICLARGLSEGGRLTSLEIREDYARLAHESLSSAGLGERVEYRIGDAHESLAALEREGRRFDLFFLDADKEGLPAYLEAAIRLSSPGALVVADNALWKDRVLDPDDDSPETRAVRRLNRMVSEHPALTGVVLPAFDGLAIARVNHPARP